MVLTTAKIRKELAKIKFSTAHAKERASQVIQHLQIYDGSVQSGGDINFVALDDAISGMVWLMEHIRYINDRQVLPSQRLFLSKAFVFIFNTHEQQRGI